MKASIIIVSTVIGRATAAGARPYKMYAEMNSRPAVKHGNKLLENPRTTRTS